MSDITPSTSALLLLDLQNEMVDPKGKIGAHGLAGIVAEAGVLEKAASALKTARACGMTVAHVRLGFRPDHADCLSVAARIQALKNTKAAVLGEWGTELPDIFKPADESKSDVYGDQPPPNKVINYEPAMFRDNSINSRL